jgi:DNA-directed RNA polymerase subunit RPC12/RpoP
LRFFDDLTDPSKNLYAALEACPNCGTPQTELVFKEKPKSEPRIVCKKCGLIILVKNRTNNIKELFVMALTASMYTFAIGFVLGSLL